MTDTRVSPAATDIPDFASYEEEATFWDTHDVTDYLDTPDRKGASASAPDLSNNTRPIRPIPKFASLEEEAAFWEANDLTDYYYNPRWVDNRDTGAASQLSVNMTVRLTPEFLGRLRREAERKGVGPSTLARMWIMEHLQETK